MRILNFLQYNNAVPIAISVLVLGAGSTFAATNPDAFYSQTNSTVSIDNTYIANKNLDAYSPQAQITGVTEDSDNYYVAYRFSTIDLKDGVWQDVVYDKTMTVSKEFLGEYRDLGEYVTEQLKQNVDSEIVRLKTTQEIERKNVTQKVVATTYGGLIGKMLDSSTQTLPGYTPVVVAPVQDMQVAAAASSDSGSTGTGSSGGTQSQNAALIGLQLLGNNPAVIPLNTNYSDLGAVLIDPNHQNVGIHVFQNGAEVNAPTVDTSTTSVATIEYRATDHNGTTVVVRRVVLIGGASDPGGEISSAGNTDITNPQPSSTPTPTPSRSESTQQTTNQDATQNATTTTATTTATEPTGTSTTTAATSTSSSADAGSSSSSTTTSSTSSESTAASDSSGAASSTPVTPPADTATSTPQA